MPLIKVPLLKINTSLKGVKKTLGILVEYYRSAFKLSSSDKFQGLVYHQDFTKVESHFLERVQSFLNTINKPKK